ncbi:trypsin-like peptidase domain-containing protein [Oscillatoria sp. FACHB-1406]|uniref:trypsin-like peptidase domain-containing protein n=1 Tax=Oscillatoria sp. FACHB-1406 TaxID=2692846 RepID=UPI001682BF0F|nr:trypsin-like peptidase domain-containing protein [Oscillatoria sp. FACHB-1406]
MKHSLVSILLSATFLTAGSANWVAAQSPTPAEKKVEPIALPFEPSTDGAAFVPSDRAQSDLPDDDSRVIISEDDRLPILSRAFPWSAIGRIEMVGDDGYSSYSCTGTLIGRDVVLTNSHCLINPNTGKPFRRPLSFKPSTIKGAALDEATVIGYDYGWKSGSENVDQDWAILKIDQPLGDTYGYMGWRSIDFSNPQTRAAVRGKIILAGYSGDFPKDPAIGQPGQTAGVNIGCSIVSTEPGLLFHDCDTNPGASGSAIFAQFDDGRFYIIGLHAGSNRRPEGVRLPDGRVSDVINRGVQVPQWAAQAAAMVR